MELIRIAKKVGNSAGVLLPKKLLGAEVKITLIKRPVNIKKRTLKLISPYLADILGIYITNKKPIEVLAVSLSMKRIIKSKFKISIVPLNIIKKDIQDKPELKEKIKRAEVILNKYLLSELIK